MGLLFVNTNQCNGRVSCVKMASSLLRLLAGSSVLSENAVDFISVSSAQALRFETLVF